MKTTHNYVYIRLVGNIWTGDFVTIGALSMTSGGDINIVFIDEEIIAKKIIAMFDSKTLKSYSAIKESLIGDIEHWKSELSKKSLYDHGIWFKEYTKPKEGIIQYSGIIRV
jgi:hypothetical protein